MGFLGCDDRCLVLGGNQREDVSLAMVSLLTLSCSISRFFWWVLPILKRTLAVSAFEVAKSTVKTLVVSLVSYLKGRQHKGGLLFLPSLIVCVAVTTNCMCHSLHV